MYGDAATLKAIVFVQNQLKDIASAAGTRIGDEPSCHLTATRADQVDLDGRTVISQGPEDH
jgi:hypothetical protein